MKVHLLLIMALLLIAPVCYGQRSETISEKFHVKLKDSQKIADSLKKALEQQQAILQKELDKKKQNLSSQQSVSDNIKVAIVPAVQSKPNEEGILETNLVVAFSYETLKDIKVTGDSRTDDYPVGSYNPGTSNACMFICDFIKNKMENEFVQYLTEGRNITIKITGETDALPIRSKLPYKGEFGDFENKMIYFNESLYSMTVTQKSGITNNAQLAFLRTQGVENFIKNYIDPFKKTNNSYQIYALENSEKGGAYRRVSIEIIIHGAYDQITASDNQLARGQKVTSGTNLAGREINSSQNILISDVDKDIPITNMKNDNCYVLIICQENYKSRNELMSNVPFALNDGNSFKEYCIKTLGVPERQVKFIKDATYIEIKSGVNWFTNIMESLNGKGKGIVYYAGHGMPNAETGTAFCVPIDVVNPEESDQLFSLSELYNKIGNVPAKSVTVFLDACFSGTKRNGEMILEGSRAVRVVPKPELLKGNTIVFSAADGAQTANPYTEQKHGLFTYFLLKNLKESKGEISYGDLYDNLKEKVSLEAAMKSKKQSPTVDQSSSLKANENWKNLNFNN